jgi:hypothetical protein
MQKLELCKECKAKLDTQPVNNGVVLGMSTSELCEECKKQLKKELL